MHRQILKNGRIGDRMFMWNYFEVASTENNIRFSINEDGSSISHSRFLELLTNSEAFRNFYNKILAGIDFEAYLWENKPITNKNTDETYECSLVNSTFLTGISPDHHTFGQYFDKNKNVVTFSNLGGDALLIVPCPQNRKSHYTHIGKFVRNSDGKQQHDFGGPSQKKCVPPSRENRNGSVLPGWVYSGYMLESMHARNITRQKIIWN